MNTNETQTAAAQPSEESTGASSVRGIAANPATAVGTALQMERESLARDIMLRRSSMPATGGTMGVGLGAGAGLGAAPAGGGAQPPGQPEKDGEESGTVLERAISLRREQHRNAMELHRRLIAANTGVTSTEEAGKAVARASLGLGTVASPRASLGLGPPEMAQARPSLGLGPSAMPPVGDATAAALSQAQMAQARAASLTGAGLPTSASAAAATSAMPTRTAGAPSVNDQKALLRLAQIRTARAEVQAAQARLAELEQHTALAASTNAAANEERDRLLRIQEAELAAAAAAAANAAAGSGNANKSGDKTDTRDLEAAEAFLSLSGRNDPEAAAAAAVAAGVGAIPVGAMPAGALPAGPGAAAGALPAGMGMEQPRRVSMDLLSSSRVPGLGSSQAALLAEALMTERRLSDAASAAAIEAAARHRRITLPVVSGYGMEQALTMSAMGGRKRKAGVGLPASPYDVMPTMPTMSSGEDYLQPSGIAVPTISQTSGKSRSRPADAPRRPLSAYNFFFIDERERLLQAMKKREAEAESSKEKEDGGDKKTGDAVEAGTEEPADKKQKVGNEGEAADAKAVDDDPLRGIDLDDSNFTPSSYDELMTLRLNNKEKPRPHRKTHGRIGFQTLAKLIASRWKALNEERRAHYKSLAAIDMHKYKVKTAEYQKKKMAKVEYGAATAKS